MMKRLIINILKRFLIIIPIVLLFLIMYEQLIVLEKNNAREKVISEHSGHLRLMEYMISTVFEEFYSTLHLVRNSNEVTSYLQDPSVKNKEEVELFFERMISNRPYIKGLAFGESPAEPLIMIHTFSQDPQVVDNSVNHPPFWTEMATEIRTQTSDGFYFSPFITSSYQNQTDKDDPMVLTGIPIYDDEKMVALLGMMIDGNHILNVIQQFFADHAGEVHFYLLDNTGHLLFSSHLELSDPANVNQELSSQIQLVSAEAEQSSQGEIFIDGNNLHFLAFDPFRETGSYYENNEHFLLGVISFTDEDILLLENSFLLRNKPLRWVLMLVIIVLGGFITILTYFRRNDRDLLAVSNLVSDQAHDGVVITDALRHVTYCNHTFELMTDFTHAQIWAGRHSVCNLDGSLFNTDEAFAHNRVPASPVSSWQGFVWLKGNRHIGLTHVMLSRVTKSQGHVVDNVGLYSYPRNLSRESSDRLILTGSSITDETDVFPLKLLEEKIASGAPCILIYMKLVNLDLIESQYTLAEHYQLSSQVRERIAMVLPSTELIVQYAPDTFALTITAEHEKEQELLHRLQAIFRSPFGLRNQQELIRVRCGISSYCTKQGDAATLLQQARMALAAQDHYEQDGWLRFDETVDENLRRYYTILQDFPPALEKHEIQVFYQPVVDVTTNAIRGAEALVRWTHPTLGPLSPGEFIPIIEKHNLERSLGKYVVHTVAQFIAEQNNRDGKEFSVSVNLCPTELQDPDLVSHIVQTLDSLALSHNSLIIELTERTLMTDIDAANSVLHQLDKQEIRVAIDDFGTGFSSLSYLHELDIDVLKIDRSFIKDYPESDDGVILKAMIRMARELDISVVVEGVELPEQLALLQSLGVSAYQGFLFSPAVDSATLQKMLLSNERYI